MNPWESLEAFKLHQQNEATRKLKQINDTLARQSGGSSTGVDSAALQEQKRLLSKQAAAFTEQAEAQDRQTQLIRKQLEQLQQESADTKEAEERQKQRRDALYSLKVQFDDILEQLEEESQKKNGYGEFIRLKKSYEDGGGGFSSILREELFDQLDYKMLCTETKKVLKKIDPLIKHISDQETLDYLLVTFQEIYEKTQTGVIDENNYSNYVASVRELEFALDENYFDTDEHRNLYQRVSELKSRIDSVVEKAKEHNPIEPGVILWERSGLRLGNSGAVEIKIHRRSLGEDWEEYKKSTFRLGKGGHINLDLKTGSTISSETEEEENEELRDYEETYYNELGDRFNVWARLTYNEDSEDYEIIHNHICFEKISGESGKLVYEGKIDPESLPKTDTHYGIGDWAAENEFQTLIRGDIFYSNLDSSDGGVMAVDLKNQKILWNFSVGQYCQNGPDKILLSDDRSIIYLPLEGNYKVEEWDHECSYHGYQEEPPSDYKGPIWKNKGCGVVALDARTGDLKWEYKEVVPGMYEAPEMFLSVGSLCVYIVETWYKLDAISGEVDAISGEAKSDFSFDYQPHTISTKFGLLVFKGAKFYLLNPDTFQVEWENDLMGGHENCKVFGDKLVNCNEKGWGDYATTRALNFVTYDISTGRVVAKTSASQGKLNGSTVINFDSQEGEVSLHDILSGDTLWRTKLPLNPVEKVDLIITKLPSVEVEGGEWNDKWKTHKNKQGLREKIDSATGGVNGFEYLKNIVEKEKISDLENNILESVFEDDAVGVRDYLGSIGVESVIRPVQGDRENESSKSQRDFLDDIRIEKGVILISLGVDEELLGPSMLEGRLRWVLDRKPTDEELSPAYKRVIENFRVIAISNPEKNTFTSNRAV